MTAFATFFAPAERAAPRTVERQARYFENAPPLFSSVLNSVPDFVAVLNQERQIIYANKNWSATLLREIKQIIGQRPGEALACTHAHEMEAGCGASASCAQCGAAQAILASQQGRPSIQECRITTNGGEALDLRVSATPVIVKNEPFTIFSAIDISHEKRRRALERIFFHDVLNTATGLLGWADLLNRARPEELTEFQAMIRHLTQEMIESIQQQKILAAAENKELVVQIIEIEALCLLEELARVYANLDICKQRHIAIDPKSQPSVLYTDPALLRRVVGNMLKNAIEASRPGETITLGCARKNKGIDIWVHNPNAMPPEVQLQVFQRSFSTKGGDRGLGTYSMKLLGERYLKGKVTFQTSDRGGTTFRIHCPLEI